MFLKVSEYTGEMCVGGVEGRGREREVQKEREEGVGERRERERIGKTWHIPYLYSKML